MPRKCCLQVRGLLYSKALKVDCFSIFSKRQYFLPSPRFVAPIPLLSLFLSKYMLIGLYLNDVVPGSVCILSQDLFSDSQDDPVETVSWLWQLESNSNNSYTSQNCRTISVRSPRSLLRLLSISSNWLPSVLSSPQEDSGV